MPHKNEYVPIQVKGHVNIVDDLGNVLLDKDNAIHSQNMARVFARALSNEPDSFINRIAFGNGGTTVDAAYTITYNPPNDGQSPDTNTWESRLYRETFSKIIDDGQTVLNTKLGIDPGSADLYTGVRPGGGSVPSSDPISVANVSGPGVRSMDFGLTSEVIISATINADEPRSQFLIDTFATTQNTETAFVFDEIGLYTSGSPAIATSGYQYINVGNRTSIDDTGLMLNTNYSFRISVNGGTPVLISFTTPVVGGSGASGQILYGDLCQAINTGNPAWGFAGANPLPGGAKISITDNTGGTFSTITGSTTYGFLKFTSRTSGATSSISLDDIIWTSHETVTSLLPSLNSPIGGILQLSVLGTGAGLQNAPTNPSVERERLLAHLIFSPILKSANRVLNITYTLTISVGRTPGV
jgi:hypothetical protein